MKVLILYPNNPSARGLAVRLLETGHDVSLFCPSERDMKNAQNITDELSFIATEQQRFRGTNFSVHEGFNIQSFEFLGKSPHETNCQLLGVIGRQCQEPILFKQLNFWLNFSHITCTCFF